MNKREEQRRIREQKQQAAQQRSARQKLMAKAAGILLVPLILIAVIYGIMSQGPVYSPVEIADVDHSRGNNEGVKLVVYADFQCPACALEHQVVAQAWNVISNRTQMVFRHYPLTGTHAHAWKAATYAEAAGMQGKFWEMYDLLFSNQVYWSALGNVDEEFDGYLSQLGLDIEQAHQDMESSALVQKIRNDQRGGTRAGVRSTPTLFLDGRMVATPQSAVELISMINEAAGS